MELFTLMFLLSAAAAEEIIVSPGDDVTLRCEAGDGFIKAVEWTRPDLKEEENVLFYTDGHSDADQQHESFRDRVQLVDRQPQDRDVSLILKNVNNNDAGMYECRVSLGASRRKKRGVIKEEPISVIRLIVREIFNQAVSPGDDVNLSCEAGNGFIKAVEWTRPDLKKGEYVLFYSDGPSDPKQQHESFKNRVQLVDRQPQDRDVSLILKKVEKNDAGTYECRVYLDASRRKKRAATDDKQIRVIHLTVEGPSRHLGLVVLGVLLLVSCIAGFLFWKHKRAEAEESTPPAASSDPAGVELINMSPSSLQPAADSPPV